MQDADCIRLIPVPHRGIGEIVTLDKKVVTDPTTYTFSYQRDTYILKSVSPIVFSLLPYPSSSKDPLSKYHAPKGLKTNEASELVTLYGKNEFHIPIPSLTALFGEHATAPFFVFQVFCVALWCLDEYWYYSLFTLFMLIVFECTVVWQVRGIYSVCNACLTNGRPQRVRTLTEFRTMSIAPYPIQCKRDGKWTTLQTDELLPGDVVSIGVSLFYSHKRFF